MKRLISILCLTLGIHVFAAPAKVLLLPFDSAGEAEKAWISKAVQQNLLAELGRLNSVTAETGAQSAGDMAGALKLAEAAGAQFVVFGSYQVVDADLRITGQVVDVAGKKAVAGLKATGTQRDLFGLEDVIANQVKKSLPAPVVVAQPEMLPQPPAQPQPAAQPDVRVADTNKRLADLEEQLDRTIERLRYRSDDGNYGYTGPVTYGYSGYYPAFGYGGYGYGYGTQYNVAIIGGYRGRHGSGHYSIGGRGFVNGGGRSFTTVPAGGNYAIHPGNTMQPVGR